jgi:hypothetical protein
VTRSTFRGWWNHPRSASVTRTSGLPWLLALPALLLIHFAAAAEAKRVLVLYGNSRLEPVNVRFDAGLRQGINADTGRPI